MTTIFESMKQRMPWGVARVVLRSVGLDAGQGWERTIAKHSEGDISGFEGRLTDALEEHILCGEKFVKIYNISEIDHRKLQDHLSLLDPEESEFSLSYPLMLDEAKLLGTDGSPKLVRIVKNSDGVGAVFANAVKLTTRETITVEDYTDQPERLLAAFDEIVGLKYNTVQLMSVVWLPHDHKCVEIRTDCPQGMATDQMHAVQAAIRREFNNLGIVSVETPVDLFDLMDSIYVDNNEGQVVELGFLTTTASVKLEKMRRPNMDLRLERYHQSGKAGLSTPIEPYRISVRWTISFDDLKLIPELTLAGTTRGRSTIGAIGSVGISGATILNCAGRADYEFVLHRMRHHLAAIDAKSQKLEA